MKSPLSKDGMYWTIGWVVISFAISNHVAWSEIRWWEGLLALLGLLLILP